jgi:transposase
MTLDELRAWILAELAISVSISTAWNTLRRLRLTLKKSP